MSDICLLHGVEMGYDFQSGFHLCPECESDGRFVTVTDGAGVVLDHYPVTPEHKPPGPELVEPAAGSCPHCTHPLTDAEVRSLWASRNSRRRQTRSGGRNGGRPRKIDQSPITPEDYGLAHWPA